MIGRRIFLISILLILNFILFFVIGNWMDISSYWLNHSMNVLIFLDFFAVSVYFADVVVFSVYGKKLLMKFIDESANSIIDSYENNISQENSQA